MLGFFLNNIEIVLVVIILIRLYNVGRSQKEFKMTKELVVSSLLVILILIRNMLEVIYLNLEVTANLLWVIESLRIITFALMTLDIIMGIQTITKNRKR